MLRLLRPLATASALLAAGFAVQAQGGAATGLPAGPIRYVVPAPPGGLIDTMARQVATGLSERSKLQVIIDNKPGAGTVLGADAVAKSAPDGATWLAVSISLAANAGMPGATFDPEKSLVPVARLAVTPMGIAVPANSPYATLEELVKAAKGGKSLNVGSSGYGTPAHLALALFQGVTHTTVSHIPYKGGAPSLVDLMGGQLDMVPVTISEAMPHIKSGKLKLLAVMSDKRLADFHQTPTTAEAGVPGLLMAGWTGVMAPAHTPAPVVQKIADQVLAVATQPDFVKRAEAQGFISGPQGPEEFNKFFKEEMARLRKLIKEQNVRME